MVAIIYEQSGHSCEKEDTWLFAFTFTCIDFNYIRISYSSQFILLDIFK